jgi:outer membrane protein assembly factor BamB
VQVIPGSAGSQVVAQTYAGMVYLFDADNGDLLWKTQIGVPYWTPQPAGHNSQSIFVTRRHILHVLNRSTGLQRVYTFDPLTKENLYGFPMDYAPSAAPVADEKRLHFSMGDWITSYLLPDFERIERLKIARAQGRKEAIKELKELYKDEEPTQDSAQPEFYWSHRIAPETTEFPPVFYGDWLSYLTAAGEFGWVNRLDRGARIELVPFKMGGRVLSAAGQYRQFAYVGSNDANLYAFNIETGRLTWRYVSGAAILQQPAVNDRDVYIAPERIGLRLVDRGSGREVWTNRDATRFLAVNDKYVYAMDKWGKFFVLDGQRGSTLAKYDLADWAIAVANEWTDRVYLAANDGQIICLRNRDLSTPLVMKSPEVIKKFEPKKVAPKKEEMKDYENKDEKKDDKKDADKKDDKKDADKKDDKKDADKKDDKKDADKKNDKKDADKKDDKKDADKKDADKMGYLRMPPKRLEVMARREESMQAAFEWPALNDRRTWAGR